MRYFEENIGVMLTALLTSLDVVSVTLSEEETGEYPYLTYENDITQRQSKDGLEAYRSSTAIRIVSDDFDEAEEISDAVMEALGEYEDENRIYAIMFDRAERTRSSGVWTITLYYIILQSCTDTI